MFATGRQYVCDTAIECDVLIIEIFEGGCSKMFMCREAFRTQRLADRWYSIRKEPLLS